MQVDVCESAQTAVAVARPIQESSNVRLNTARSGVRQPERNAVSYLVDPASGHMLVSKIKPCMS